MKSKIKVRQHRNAARPSPQAKTTRNHKPETVRIVINDAAGKPFADFELPQAMRAGMERAAQRDGISLLHWIENAVRAKYAAAKPAAPVPVADDISLIFFSVQEGASIASLDLTCEQFQALQHRAKLENKTLEELLNIGLAQMLRPRNFLALWSAFMPVESSIKAATALLMLLAEKTEDSDLDTLASQTVMKLNDDARAVCAAFNTSATAPDNAEVAS